MTVAGEIVDNYANVTYSLMYDNSASETAREVSWFFALQEGVRLSNMSVAIGEEIYWGRAMREEQAIDVFNASVEANETAALVVREYGGYRVTLNVRNNTVAILSVYVEGLLTRDSGLYNLRLPIAVGQVVWTDFSFDMTIKSHYGPIAGYGITGIPSFTATDLANGVRLQYSAPEFSLPDWIRLTYGLDRQTGGSQLLVHDNGSDKFFTYLLAPSITEVSDRAYRQYVFVIDKSGSMGDQKMEQAKTAFNAMVEDLGPYDVFNIVRFDTTVDILWVEPHSATEANVETAQTWISGTYASGSTNFHGACMEGLRTFYEGDYVKVMFMLSDGLPTAGEIVSTQGILAAVQEANVLDVSISTVAFGSGADENLMANLAAQNSGFFAFIQPDDNAASKLFDFYEQFATPIAHSYSIQVNGAEDVNTLQPLEDSPFFNGSEVVISGRYLESVDIQTSIAYVTGTENYENSATDAPFDQPHVEYIWAQHRISYLLELQRLLSEDLSRRDEVISIALDYGIIVEGYTALVLTAYDAVESPPDDITIPTTTTAWNPPYTTTNTWTTTSGAWRTTTTGAPADFTVSIVAGSASFAVIVLLGFAFLSRFVRKKPSG
ncbi:MAG: VWA domain-containing protein [Promethearchaeota archaeon]